jgi:hypothetical protein
MASTGLYLTGPGGLLGIQIRLDPIIGLSRRAKAGVMTLTPYPPV